MVYDFYPTTQILSVVTNSFTSSSPPKILKINMRPPKHTDISDKTKKRIRLTMIVSRKETTEMI